MSIFSSFVSYLFVTSQGQDIPAAKKVYCFIVSKSVLSDLIGMFGGGGGGTVVT